MVRTHPDDAKCDARGLREGGRGRGRGDKDGDNASSSFALIVAVDKETDRIFMKAPIWPKQAKSIERTADSRHRLKLRPPAGGVIFV